MSADTVRWRAGRFGGSYADHSGYRLDVSRPSPAGTYWSVTLARQPDNWRSGKADTRSEAKQQAEHAVRVLTTNPDIPGKENR